MVTPVTITSFRAMFPELATTPDATVTFWLGQSDPFFDQSRWDDLYLLGCSYWIAHSIVLATLNATSQAVDDVVMKKIDGLQKQRDSTLMNAMAENPYLRTTYGQLYWDYAQKVGAGAWAV